MEPKFQSSFIPKGPIATSGASSASSSKTKGIFGVIATAIFALSVLGGVGVFAYNYYLGHRITKMGEEIENAREALQPEVIEEITRLDARLKSTETLLDGHTVISPLFEYLQGSTVQAVRFTDLIFETVEEGLRIVLKGEAQGYIAVARQSELFNESGHFMEPVFSDLMLDNEGNVTFVFTGLVNPELLSYKRLVEGNPPPPVEVETTEVSPVQEATTTPAVQNPAPTPATTTPPTTTTPPPAPSSTTAPATVI